MFTRKPFDVEEDNERMSYCACKSFDGGGRDCVVS